MRRIVSVYPNLLVRDVGALRANVRSLRQLLRADQDAVCALLRREPGLLSYNMSTLATRWTWAMQVGRGEREGDARLLRVAWQEPAAGHARMDGWQLGRCLPAG